MKLSDRFDDFIDSNYVHGVCHMTKLFATAWQFLPERIYKCLETLFLSIGILIVIVLLVVAPLLIPLVPIFAWLLMRSDRATDVSDEKGM